MYVMWMRGDLDEQVRIVAIHHLALKCVEQHAKVVLARHQLRGIQMK